MARSNNTLRFTATAVAVVAVAFSVGYFFLGGSRSAPPAPENAVSQNPVPQSAPISSKPRLIATAPRAKNGDYTAPGAPRIHITEERTPSLTNTSQKQPKRPKPPDAEASQEAPPPPQPVAIVAASPDVPAADSAAAGAATVAGGTDSAPKSNPADPDQEQVGNSEAGQESKAQYRVQTGAFVAASNANVLAEALKRRGYSTSTHAEKQGDKTVYKVQIGAYRTKAAADKAALDLQSSGYPAYVSPVSP